MTLRFFRKHKKWGRVLLLGAVFAMVTFGSLAYAPRLLEQMKRRAQAEEARFELKNYGKEVSRIEAWEIQQNLRRMARFRWVIEQIMKSNPSLAQILTPRRMAVVNQYASPMPRLFAAAGGITEENLSPEAIKVWHATAVLLKEAEMAGVVVTEEMARVHRDQWRGAGVEDNLINSLAKLSFFPGDMQNKQVSQEVLEQRLIPAIRQEMVLNIYLSAAMGSGKAFEEDVNQIFRLRTERAEIRKVDLRMRSYRSKVDEPTEEAIQTHFEKYKDRLADETENLFGCKLPNRVKFEYLKLKVDSFKADIQITDEEIEAYYEENKDPQYVVQEKEQPKADQPSGDEDQKANDGGGADAATDAAPPEAGPAQPEPEQSPADQPAAAPEEGAATQEPAAGQTAEAEKPDEKPEPEKKFKPLAEVRDSIKTALLDGKAMKACRDKAEEIHRQLLRRPQLSLENMADGKYVVYLPAKELYSQEDIRLRTPGIGNSFMPSRDPQAWRPTFFGDLVFRIEPFTDEPEIFKGRPTGVLSDAPGNGYIFVVTEAKEAEVPETVDPVREKVVHDLKKAAAYKLAEREAEELLALARQKGLDEAVKEKDLKVAVTPEALRRPFEGYEDPMAIKVFEAVDTTELYGQVGTAKLSRVTVFEIKDVVRVTDTEYKANRSWVTGQAIRLARASLLRKLIDPDRLIKRSGFVDVRKPDKDDKAQDGPDRIGKQETQADEAKAE